MIMIKKEEYADSTMRAMNKSMLIEYIHRLTRNLRMLDAMNDNQYVQLYKLQPCRTWFPRSDPPAVPVDPRGYLCRVIAEKDGVPFYMVAQYDAVHDHFTYEGIGKLHKVQILHWTYIPTSEEGFKDGNA